MLTTDRALLAARETKTKTYIVSPAAGWARTKRQRAELLIARLLSYNRLIKVNNAEPNRTII